MSYVAAACIDENGNITGGKAGDQSGGEVMVQTLSSSGTWSRIYRPPVNGRNTIVQQAYNGAYNDNIGYDNNNRTSLYYAAKAVGWDLSAITTACECDCSSFVATVCNCAGYAVSPDMHTYTEDVLTDFGFTKMTYYESILTAGDILWRDGHTGIYVGTSSSYSQGSSGSSGDGGTESEPQFVISDIVDCILTTDSDRITELELDGYTDAGTMFYSSGTDPVYELYNSSNGTHLYTSSESERSKCVSNGWTDNGIAFYAVYTGEDYEDGKVPDSDTAYADDATYIGLLQADGSDTLLEHTMIDSFDAEVENNYSFIYNKDYFVGDIVDIESPYGSLLGQARVTEGVVSYDSDGYRVYCNYEMISTPQLEEDSEWVHRLYNPNTGCHYYTLDAYTYNLRLNEGWQDEGEHWCPPESGYRVYSLYSQIIHDHLLTTDKDEYDKLKEATTTITDDDGNETEQLTWTDEGVVFYADGDYPVYRMYNKYLDKHLFTTSKTEYDSLEFKDWTKEGIGFYAAEI